MSKAVLVTGATGQLGQEVCKVLSEANYNVFGTTLPGSNESSPYAELLEADLTNEEGAVSVISEIRKQTEGLHAIICLAGGFGMSNVSNTRKSDLTYFFDLNFQTSYQTIQASWEWMVQKGGGRIILIGAKPAVEGGAFEVLPYALSKGSVIQLAGILNEKSNETGIVSSVIVPSILDTPGNRKAMPDANTSDWVSTTDIANQIAHLLAVKSKSLRETILKMYGNS